MIVCATLNIKILEEAPMQVQPDPMQVGRVRLPMQLGCLSPYCMGDLTLPNRYIIVIIVLNSKYIIIYFISILEPQITPFLRRFGTNMSISYHKVQNLPFYSLNQFTQLQPLSRGKSAIYLYQHNQSQEIFVVKEVPYSEERLKVYQIVIKSYGLGSLIRIRGLCKMVIKYEKFKKKRNQEISQHSLYIQKNKDQQTRQQSKKEQEQNFQKKDKKITSAGNGKQQQWILLFMQKCHENLAEHIKNRRRQRKPFKCQEVTNFISQTLILLQTLQKQNVSHRDIKPENFLYDKGKFKLCDFDGSIYLDTHEDQSKRQYDMTTVEYTSPQFFRNFRQPKNKIFDPYKLDLYALGITIIYMCSMGKFDLSERRQYLEQNSVFHNNYMKDQRRRFLKNNDEYKNLNTVVKMMLEQDQYKRDNFVTFLMKIRPILNLRELDIHILEEQAISQNSKSEESRRKFNKTKKKPKKNNWENTTQIQRKSLKSVLILAFSFFILLLII